MMDELEKQDKKIKKQITRKGLTEGEKQNTINIEIIKWDMELFF